MQPSHPLLSKFYTQACNLRFNCSHLSQGALIHLAGELLQTMRAINPHEVDASIPAHIRRTTTSSPMASKLEYFITQLGEALKPGKDEEKILRMAVRPITAQAV